MNKSIIVLGGTGFLGNEIIITLKKNNFDVSCGSRNKCKIKNVKNLNIDILNQDDLKRKCAPFDIIINCTGQITTPISECYELNTVGISNIINACKQTKKKIIHISTTSVYGTVKYADENSPLNPETPYAACKCFAEYLLKGQVPSRQLTILRISNLFGSGQKKGIFNYLLKSFRGKKDLFFDNNGDLSRFYLNVDDCAQNIAKLIQTNSYHGIYNLVGNRSYSIKKLIKLIENKTKYHFTVKYTNQKPYENIGYISNNKIKKNIREVLYNKVENYLTDSLSNIINSNKNIYAKKSK